MSNNIIVTISRSNVYSIAEGISVSISQHNGGTPTFEQLWASADESRKLDIYYREAISDLERHLTEWIQESSLQFNLTEDGPDNYVLTLSVSLFWPERLQGLLANKIQDYMVHAVTAGWLNDFAGLEIKQDYQALAGQDLSDIRTVIYKREYNFQGNERAGSDYKNSTDIQVAARLTSNDKDNNDINVSARAGNDDKDSTDIQASKRSPDGDKDGALFRPEVGYRRDDNISKHANEDTPPYCRPKLLRHRDNAVVDTHSDHTDWSGAGIAYAPCLRPPFPPIRRNDPRIPDNPTHPNYPPFHVDGIGWSDEMLYDQEGSEHYINH